MVYIDYRSKQYGISKEICHQGEINISIINFYLRQKFCEHLIIGAILTRIKKWMGNHLPLNFQKIIIINKTESKECWSLEWNKTGEKETL